MTITIAILCGMTSELHALQSVFGSYPNVAIFSGNDRLHLPELVPTTVARIIDMGLGGGLGPPDPYGYVLKVPDVVSATTLADKRGDLIDDFQGLSGGQVGGRRELGGRGTAMHATEITALGDFPKNQARQMLAGAAARTCTHEMS